MSPIVDDKKYATDSRSYRDAVLQDNLIHYFDESPISKLCQIKDICVYKPGDLNKNGKEGKTSWDSFSYALLMGHNVWMHIESVQRANREFDAGRYPYMMKHELDTGDGEYFADIVERIFSAPTKQAALDIVNAEKYARSKGYWEQIIGTRGFKGEKTTNSNTQFNNHFELEGSIKVDKVKKQKAKPILLSKLFEEE
jgi:hypothetical protein